jgi:hypothetical protein
VLDCLQLGIAMGPRSPISDGDFLFRGAKWGEFTPHGELNELIVIPVGGIGVRTFPTSPSPIPVRDPEFTCAGQAYVQKKPIKRMLAQPNTGIRPSSNLVTLASALSVSPRPSSPPSTQPPARLPR